MTDATRNNAEQWHIPPVGETVTRGEHVCPPPPPLVNLEPLILHFERELQRIRDQLAVERTAASSAREALVVMTAKADEWRHECAAGVAKQARLVEERDAARSEAQRLADKASELQAQLDLARSVATAATVAVCRPEPGSVEAVKEAIRLLTGNDPEVCAGCDLPPWWCTALEAKTPTSERESARMALLRLLESLQPAASVKP